MARNRVPSPCASCNQWCPHGGVLNKTRENVNIYVSFCNNFHVSVLSFAVVINFWNCKETLWTPCTSTNITSTWTTTGRRLYRGNSTSYNFPETFSPRVRKLTPVETAAFFKRNRAPLREKPERNKVATTDVSRVTPMKFPPSSEMGEGRKEKKEKKKKERKGRCIWAKNFPLDREKFVLIQEIRERSAGKFVRTGYSARKRGNESPRECLELCQTQGRILAEYHYRRLDIHKAGEYLASNQKISINSLGGAGGREEFLPFGLFQVSS